MGVVAGTNFSQKPIGASYPSSGRILRQIVTGMFFAGAQMKIEIAKEGQQGGKGWSPVYGVVTDGNNRYFRLTDWTGGEGIKPSVPANNYLGATGLVFSTSDAINIRGIQGLTGKGIQSTSYNSGTGVLTFTFTDSTTYSTGDLRGANGVGISDATYDSETQQMTLVLSNSSEIVVSMPMPAPLKGWAPIYASEVSGDNVFIKIVDYANGEGTKPSLPTNRYLGASGFVAIGSAINFAGIPGADGIGIASISYDAGTGVLTITLTDSSFYTTEDLRGADGFGATVIDITGGTLSLNDLRLNNRYYCEDFGSITNTPSLTGGSFFFLDVMRQREKILHILEERGESTIKRWTRYGYDGGAAFTSWTEM